MKRGTGALLGPSSGGYGAPGVGEHEDLALACTTELQKLLWVPDLLTSTLIFICCLLILLREWGKEKINSLELGWVVNN